MHTFQGILPALVTPFDGKGRLHTASVERLLARLYAADVHGVYLCGSTGEGMLQPLAQRKQMAEIAMKNSPPDKQVIVHVGANTTAEAIELARHAAQVGAHAISSLPPMVGGYSFAEIKTFYEQLAAASELPLLLYYFPEVSPAIKTAEQVLELAGLPNVAGLKFTDYDLYAMLRLKRQGATVFYGRDEMLTAGLLFGADGGIGSFYNVIPHLFMEVWYLTRENRHDAALGAQQQINEFITITLRYPLFPALKAILSWTGIDCGPCLAPRRAFLTPGETEQLRSELQAAGLLDVVLNSIPFK
ncbi:MAG: dihydrodipicolinate synthase family protein [Blastocatellia bacterium]